MADIKKGANEPFLYDDQTDRITGLKNSDATEKKFVYTDGSSGPVVITDTTASTSTTTGALRVAGGVGIGGALYTGTDAVINGARVGIGPAGTDNTVLGVGVGAALTGTSTNNVMVGDRAGQQSTSSSNVFIGSAAGRTGSLPSANIAIGHEAMEIPANSAGVFHNIAAGYRAGWALSGQNNVAIGQQALAAGVSQNTAVGQGALQRTRGSEQTAVGSGALNLSTLGTANVAVGRSALGAATTAIGTFTTTPVAAGSGYTANQTGVTVTLVKKSGADTFTGTVQAALTTDGSGAVTAVTATPVSAGSTFTGSNVIFEPSGFGGSGCEISIATLATAASNTAVGHQAGLSLTTASNCTLIGAGAGDAITTATRSTCVGSGAGGSITSGSFNACFGWTAGGSLTTDTNVAAFGDATLADAAGGAASGATAIGQGALGRITLAGGGCNSTVAIGHNAARFIADGSTNCTAAISGTYIGAGVRVSANGGVTNEIAIGNAAIADGTNTTVIGTTATTQARIRGATFLSTGANGQSTQLGQSTTLLSGLTGATVTATNLIPANSILLGVTARVTTEITGATTFDIGDGTTANRFGDDVAIALNTTSQNCIAPALITAATNVVLTANGSNFTGGAVRLTAHFMTLVAPTS